MEPKFKIGDAVYVKGVVTGIGITAESIEYIIETSDDYEFTTAQDNVIERKSDE